MGHSGGTLMSAYQALAEKGPTVFQGPEKLYPYRRKDVLPLADGRGAGQYVIIETDTAFQVSRFARSYEVTMAAGVTRTGTITTESVIITPSTAEVCNYEEVTYTGYAPNTGEARPPERCNCAKEGTFAIAGIDGCELHTIESGTAFRAADCFEETNGQYRDFDLPCALYVPDDYDPAQSYALIPRLHDAGSMSSNPMLTLNESQAASNYASDWFQQLAKERGLAARLSSVRQLRSLSLWMMNIRTMNRAFPAITGR